MLLPSEKSGGGIVDAEIRPLTNNFTPSKMTFAYFSAYVTVNKVEFYRTEIPNIIRAYIDVNLNSDNKAHYFQFFITAPNIISTPCCAVYNLFKTVQQIDDMNISSCGTLTNYWEGSYGSTAPMLTCVWQTKPNSRAIMTVDIPVTD